jgi:hypothetical protein
VTACVAALDQPLLTTDEANVSSSRRTAPAKWRADGWTDGPPSVLKRAAGAPVGRFRGAPAPEAGLPSSVSSELTAAAPSFASRDVDMPNSAAVTSSGQTPALWHRDSKRDRARLAKESGLSCLAVGVAS